MVVVYDAKEMKSIIRTDCYSRGCGEEYRPSDNKETEMQFYESLTYPKILEYHEAWDSHCCGTWIELNYKSSREKLLSEWTEQAMSLDAKIERLRRSW